MKKIVYFLFVKNFWWGLSTTILFLLMIPAMKDGALPIWIGISLSVLFGWLSGIFSRTYDKFNPLRGIFGKKEHE